MYGAGADHSLVHSFNRSGIARTRDHVMRADAADGLGPCAKRKAKKLEKVKGKGRWKCWTSEAVLKTGNANPLSSGRNSGPEGAGHTSAGHARLINV